MGLFGPMSISILGSTKILMSDILANILQLIFECGYQKRVTKIRYGGRKTDKHQCPPSAGQTTQLHHFKSLVTICSFQFCGNVLF